MTEDPNALPPPKHHDRSAGLIVFGVLTILAGAFCALIVPIILFGNTASSETAAASASQAKWAAAVYGVLAVIMIWLGVGSIMARRWARALILIISWTWLLTGVLALAFIAVLLPKISSAIPSSGPSGPLSENAKLAILLFPLGIIFFLMVALPGIWVLFYRSRNVRLTCEHRDPVTRWTDRCPLPVLAISLWLAAGALSMIFAPLGGSQAVVPFFGIFLHGLTGTLTLFAIAALWFYAARACYRLNPVGWWIVLASLGLFAVSHFITYSVNDMPAVYRLMGYSAEQIAQIEKFNFLNSRTLAWVSLIWTIPAAAYLVYARKFFPKRIRL